ncbi:hypothetical protein FGO68_gene5385 [Halteria grandinella]|uniref:Uncharacterized protein n=1 Tax=Halteria grandinella TaxID=5974 RepID=A0A8J8TBB9_HALGN|nr:hypothetical protein FGO68_gene5385 [Halteria grandinella]
MRKLIPQFYFAPVKSLNFLELLLMVILFELCELQLYKETYLLRSLLLRTSSQQTGWTPGGKMFQILILSSISMLTFYCTWFSLIQRFLATIQPASTIMANMQSCTPLLAVLS